jgi:adenylate cyclase
MVLCESNRANARRVLLRVRVTDIPGPNQKRFHKLGNDFSQHQFERNIQDKPSLLGYDHPHIPGDFDSDQPSKRWFIYDFNVKGPLTKEQTLALPHEVYVASRQDEQW